MGRVYRVQATEIYRKIAIRPETELNEIRTARNRLLRLHREPWSGFEDPCDRETGCRLPIVGPSCDHGSEQVGPIGSSRGRSLPKSHGRVDV